MIGERQDGQEDMSAYANKMLAIMLLHVVIACAVESVISLTLTFISKNVKA